MPGSSRKDRYTTTYLELALYGCCRHGAETTTKMVKCLLLAGADANEHSLDASRKKISVLHCAVQRDLRGCAQLLLEHGAVTQDVEVLRTAIEALADRGAGMVQLLLKHGASPNYVVRQTGAACNLLFEACAVWCCVTCQIEVVEALVAAGADVNMRTASGITPIMCARQAPTARALIGLGADVFAKDNSGLTVVDHAEENECEEVAALIKQTIEDIENELPPLEWVFQRKCCL